MEMAKDPAAVSLGSRGGKARARNLTHEQLSEIGATGARARMVELSPEQRSEIARAAARARWAARKASRSSGE